MKVLECNVCGETLSAANDEELVACVERHYSDRHESIDAADARELVAGKAYEATDS